MGRHAKGTASGDGVEFNHYGLVMAERGEGGRPLENMLFILQVMAGFVEEMKG